jgi:hypothetical protein
MSSSNKKTGLDALLTPETSVLVLIDHQPFQFANLQHAGGTGVALLWEKQFLEAGVGK